MTKDFTLIIITHLYLNNLFCNLLPIYSNIVCKKLYGLLKKLILR